MIYGEAGSAAVTGPAYPYARTLDLTLAILFTSALAVTHLLSPINASKNKGRKDVYNSSFPTTNNSSKSTFEESSPSHVVK